MPEPEYSPEEATRRFTHLLKHASNCKFCSDLIVVMYRHAKEKGDL